MALQKTFLKALYICTLSLLLSGFSFGQSNFKEGFIVTANGDTVKGQVSFEEKNSSNNKVFLRRGSSIEEYWVVDVRSFKHGEGRFISRLVEVDQTPLEITSSGYFSPFTAEKQVFLREVVGGEMPLYYYYDFRPHYFIKSDSGLMELISNQYVVIRKNRRIVVTRNEFLYQILLEEEYPACSNLNIKRVSYKESSLRNFMTRCAVNYGLEVSLSIPYEYQKVETSLKRHFYAGSEYNTLRYLIPKWDSDLAPDLVITSSVSGFKIGGALKIERTRAQKKRAFILGLDYSHYKAQDDDDFESFGFIAFSPSYVAYLSPKRFTGLVEIGLPLSLRVGSSGLEEFDDETKFTPSYFVGLGAQYDRFFIKSRYEYKGKLGKVIRQRILMLTAGIDL